MDLMPVRGLDGQHDHVAQEGTTVTWSHVMNVCTPHEGVDAARTMTPAIAAGTPTKVDEARPAVVAGAVASTWPASSSMAQNERSCHQWQCSQNTH